MHSTKLIVTLTFVILASGAEAQQRQWCLDDFDYNPAHPMAAARLLSTVRGPEPSTMGLMEEDWRAINAALAQAFRNYLFDAGLDVNDPNLVRFLAELDIYLASDTLRFGYMRARYNDAVGRMSLEFEPRPAAPNPNTLGFDCSTLSSDPEGAAILYFADTLVEYGRSGFVSAVQLTAGVIGDIYATHRNRLYNGLPMWPQETFINGLGTDFESAEPRLASRTQWVFLRPSIAPALRFDGTDNSELDAALMVELFGGIRYRRGSEFRKWQGGSVVATVTGSNGVGIGGIYRYDNYILGAAYHDDTNDWLLYASIDLYDLVFSERKRTGNANEFLSELAEYLKQQGLQRLDELAGNVP